jgi:hypothetical protein
MRPQILKVLSNRLVSNFSQPWFCTWHWTTLSAHLTTPTWWNTNWCYTIPNISVVVGSSHNTYTHNKCSMGLLFITMATHKAIMLYNTCKRWIQTFPIYLKHKFLFFISLSFLVSCNSFKKVTHCLHIAETSFASFAI